ncbi:MAG: hypothetical protein D3924_10965, partial [Candidatus Electrothrix sp. AR4]|nr:hypothetical protein [Candidatus Electrothrix sp. AR4]
MKKQQWSIADLIDLEFFLNQDEGEDLDRLAARDRKLYTELPSAIREAKPDSVVLLRAWLSSRRKTMLDEVGEIALPGSTG